MLTFWFLCISYPHQPTPKSHCSSLRNPVCKVWSLGHCPDLLVLGSYTTTTVPWDTLPKWRRSSRVYTQALLEHFHGFVKNKSSSFSKDLYSRPSIWTQGIPRFEEHSTQRKKQVNSIWSSIPLIQTFTSLFILRNYDLNQINSSQDPGEKSSSQWK